LRTDTIYISSAKCKIQTDNLTGADRDLMKAVSANQKNEEALMLRAEVTIKKGRSSSAVSYLQRVVRINDKNEKAWYMLGDIQFQQKRYEKAIGYLNKSIAAKKNAEAYYLRGASFYALRNKNKACADTQKAAELGHKQAKKDVSIICK